MSKVDLMKFQGGAKVRDESRNNLVRQRNSQVQVCQFCVFSFLTTSFNKIDTSFDFLCSPAHWSPTSLLIRILKCSLCNCPTNVVSAVSKVSVEHAGTNTHVSSRQSQGETVNNVMNDGVSRLLQTSTTSCNGRLTQPTC